MENKSLTKRVLSPKKTVLILILRLLLLLSLFKQLSVLKLTLDRMSTTGKSFPLQTFLGYFQSFWNFTDTFWNTILGNNFAYHLFENYIWGGFTYMAVIWSLILYLQYHALDCSITIPKLAFGRSLILFYVVFFALTIIYGLNRDQWIPYVQEPSWEINLAHKQQVSAGTFLIVLYLIWVYSYFPSSRANKGSVNFLLHPKLVTYTFLCMNLDNFASFNWFPGFIDPDNSWLNGYEEIFQHGQTWTSSDKIYHFTMSSVAIIILLMYVSNPKKAILGAISIVIFWELFEISLNPKEASDSLLDMIINTCAIILAAYIIGRLNVTPIQDNPNISSKEISALLSE